MGSLPRVLHRSAAPVSIEEFAEAIRAACPPRHPRARATCHRRVGMAISGGVDSMALALLFSRLRSRDASFVIGDHPCGGAYAFVVDHKLRENSTAESQAVVAELSKLAHLYPRRLELDWEDTDPHTMTGLETAARRLRYRALGTACANTGVTSMLTGHHADDLYETVLMRMLAGHPARGLAGIRRFNHIPECYDMHRVYQSGLLDVMHMKNPPLSYKLPKRASHHLRTSLLADMRPRLLDSDEDTLERLTLKNNYGDPEEDADADADAGLFADVGESVQWHTKPRANLMQLEAEDGGVRISRPLLGFEKERLVATCEAAGMRWFEDPTNDDPKLTARNAVRHMVRTSKLPAALQRPAILRLSERVRERAQSEEDEATALLEKTEILDVRTNTGTMVVEPPDLLPGDDLDRSRAVASILVRRLISVVTPEPQTAPLPSLQGTVSRLFPRLATPTQPSSSPSSFNVASVLFTRLPSASTTPEKPRWLLSRAPHPSAGKPPPSLTYFQKKGYPNHGILSHPKSHWTFINQPWRLFDGRFWLQLNLRLAGTITIAPFRPEFSKPFKQALPKEERERLEGLLAYAPGKVRYTLPAVYYDGEVDLENMQMKVQGPKMMLALPSLGVGLPGLEEVFDYEIRYRKIDARVLEKSNVGFMPGGDLV